MSQNCPTCGVANRLTSRFCANCGALLTAGQLNDAPQIPAGAQGTGSEDAESARAPEAASDAPTFVVRRWEGDLAASSPDAPTLPIFAADTSASEPYDAYAPPQESDPQAGPGLTIRRAGSAYAPYSNEAAASVERSRGGRSWLMPVIVISVLSLALLGAVSGYLLMTGRATLPQAVTGEPTKSEPLQSEQLPANATEEDRVKQVVRQSNDEQITAWRELDTEILKGTRTGDILRENIEMVEALKAHGMYAIPENQRLDILDVKIAGETATVRTIEVWTVSFYKTSDKSLIQTKGPDTFTETYYLVKQDGKWMVNKLDIDEDKDKGTPDSTQ